MEVARIFERLNPSKVYGMTGNINLTTNNNNFSIITDYKFKGTVKEYLNNQKDIKALKMVMLEEQYLERKASELSENELKSISLAKALLENKDYIVLDYFEKGLNHKEKENYKRIFKKLATEYHKTILIFTNDLTFIWDIIDQLIIVDNNEVINKISKTDLFEFIKLIDKPEITQFIDLMRAKNIKIEDYKNSMDLLKAIYRIKGE